VRLIEQPHIVKVAAERFGGEAQDGSRCARDAVMGMSCGNRGLAAREKTMGWQEH